MHHESLKSYNHTICFWLNVKKVQQVCNLTHWGIWYLIYCINIHFPTTIASCIAKGWHQEPDTGFFFFLKTYRPRKAWWTNFSCNRGTLGCTVLLHYVQSSQVSRFICCQVSPNWKLHSGYFLPCSAALQCSVTVSKR